MACAVECVRPTLFVDTFSKKTKCLHRDRSRYQDQDQSPGTPHRYIPLPSPIASVSASCFAFNFSCARPTLSINWRVATDLAAIELTFAIPAAKTREERRHLLCRLWRYVP